MDSLEDEDLDVESDEDPDSEDDSVRDMVREAVMAVVREGETEAVALIEGVESAVAERERLWLWVNVIDPDPDTVAIEDMVMELLGDMETLSDEEGVSLEDVVNDEVPEILELDEVVADTLVLRDRSVVGDADGDTGDSVLDCVTDKDATRDEDMVDEGARDTLVVIEGVRVSLRLALTDRESVGSVDPLAVTLLDIEVDPVSEAVKLGDTGDFVKDGVGVGDGMITVYDMKNTDPDPRLIMLAPI